MLSFLNSLFSGLFGFLNQLLPGNPLSGMLAVSDNMRVGLGWLNWLVPLQGMVAMATIWLMACVAVVGVKLAISISRRLSFELPIGHNGGYTG